MPRKFRSAQNIDTRTARAKLKPRGLPYWETIAPGVALGYRKNRTGAGTWNVRVADGKGGKPINSLKVIADDFEDADGEHVLTFWQAIDKARAFGRGHEQHGIPGTVDECLTEYERELQVRGSDVKNARRVRVHLTPQLLATPLGLLTGKLLRRWRDGLLASGMSAENFTRTAKALRSALNLAADRDVRLNPSGRSGVRHWPRCVTRAKYRIATSAPRRPAYRFHDRTDRRFRSRASHRRGSRR